MISKSYNQEFLLLSWLTAQIYLSRLAGWAKKETLASFTTVLDFYIWKDETILE